MIFGGGPYFENAKNESKDLKNVFIHELMPQNRISEVYSLGNVALITCKKGTGKAGMPSKLWSIMACNTPIIASFDTGSDLADVIKDARAGKCVEPGNVFALSEAIKEFSNYQGVKDVDLRKYVYYHAGRRLCVSSYIDILKNHIY